jgi:hypothetical protein
MGRYKRKAQLHVPLPDIFVPMEVIQHDLWAWCRAA